jgi:5,10-methylenetetrahydromethanopterin reductase
MAARGDKALNLCGRIADGLMVSNMCPHDYTARAVNIVQEAAVDSGRAIPTDVIQYVPSIPGIDGEQARAAIKTVLAAMLKQYWAVPSAKAAMRYSNIREEELVAAVDRITGGEPPEHVLCDRFVDAFAIAGTAAECLDRIDAYARAGVSELVLTFVGAQPVAAIEYLGRALRRS